MNKAEVSHLVKSSLLISSALIGCAALGMILNPNTFHKFFSPVQLVSDLNLSSHDKNYYWDVKFYAQIVLSNQCIAFYPLWPLLIRLLFHPQTLDQAAHTLLTVSTVISFACIPLLIWLFSKALKQSHLAFILVLAFVLNPMSIFRVIGYTESLFSIFCAIFIWLCLPQTKLNYLVRLFFIFIVTVLMSLTRPVLIQMVFASTATLGTLFFFENLRLEASNWRSLLRRYTQEIKLTFTICISALLGYSIYGIFCWYSRGDFFAPFNDQKYWASKSGIHTELLLLPKSPLFDLLGLYFPIIVLLLIIAFVYCKLKAIKPLVWLPQSPLWNILLLYPPLSIILYIAKYLRFKGKAVDVKAGWTHLIVDDFVKRLSRSYLPWFCVYFPVAHCLIVLLTRDRLYSLARFVFGNPFFFLALGYLYCCMPGKKQYQTLWWLILISTVALVQQWVDYGQNRWLG